MEYFQFNKLPSIISRYLNYGVFMNQDILNRLSVIVNPHTGKTLKEENRIVEAKHDESGLVFKYKRDGISPEAKREIESKVIMAMKGFVEADKITVLTISENSNDVYKSTPNSTPSAAKAELKAGHGPTGLAKRRVQNVKKVIAVSSCKGGVGKSTVTVNLGLALKSQGFKVGFLDADVYGPSLPMLLNHRGTKPSANEQKKIIPVEAYGTEFISFGLFINENDPVIWRGPMLGGVLNQFLFDVDWGELDYLIIDLPPGTGDMQLSMIQATEVDGVVVVSTPQDIAVLDTKKGLQMFNQVKTPVIGMVENMSYFIPEDAPDKKYYIFGQDGVKKAAEELSSKFLAEIPLEIAVRIGSDAGEPYMANPKNEGKPVWNAYQKLAKEVDGHFYPDKNKNSPGFFKKIFS